MRSRKTMAGLLMLAAAFAAAAADNGMEPRVEPCAACHGVEGRSSREGYYPSIAGKPAGYLHQQLLNFRDGRRRNTVMESMLAYLSDDYLHEIADYYTVQTPAVRGRQAQVSTQDLELGRQLVIHGDSTRSIPACTSCHGAGLLGAQPSIPGLLALSPDYLAAQLGAWKTGVRKGAPPDCMAEIARALTGAEIRAVTAWIASQPVPADHRPAARPTGTLPMPCGGVQ